MNRSQSEFERPGEPKHRAVRCFGLELAAAIALSNLRAGLAIPDLVQALARESTVRVRWDCILALGQIGDQTLTPMLRALVASEPSPVLRGACQAALDEIQLRAARRG